ncbi:hypothetical protein [Aeromonas schubertii]|uniref:Motility protein n=1 Tax=Aeromonas schubertii TaxID=652 RepID=A0A0S2SN35_9GAMM|nr:hypothetical protein [Aeromonas schubertii]ALP43151.1 hypothetical protein WL1483_3732 [Aeromonas schubertii]KUE79825.1 hypothetical protein ATO46_17640 [Aeromonas schubertii]MBZ6066487.1 hypothetical protein [Aeromonas schubertii]MBZ6073349.1 hypothetical protein [Aeromonas schubertii]QCG49588.1 hypothetical protein E2P79_18745 [Aeromonas schubertii]
MEISGSTAVAQSRELLTASLAKKQQEQQGQAALELLQTATQSAPAPQSAGGTLGSNIDIRV